MRNVQVGQNPCQDHSAGKQAELQCRIQSAVKKAFSPFFPSTKSQTSSPTLSGTSSLSTATLGPPTQTQGDAPVVPSPEATASAPSPTSTTHARDTPPQTQKTSSIASPKSASTATPAASISTMGQPNALVTPGAHIKRNNQAPLILAITSTAVVVVLICLGLSFFIWRRRKSKRRSEEDWKWLDGWRRRHKSLSIVSGGEDVSRPEKTHADGGQELLRRPSLRSKASTLQRFGSIASKAKRKFRTISMGDVTNNTRTTSNTNFIVAAPPPRCDDAHDRNRSNFKYLTFGYYDPPPPTPIQHQPSSDDFLTTAGIRAAEKLLSTDIGAHM